MFIEECIVFIKFDYVPQLGKSDAEKDASFLYICEFYLASVYTF